MLKVKLASRLTLLTRVRCLLRMISTYLPILLLKELAPPLTDGMAATTVAHCNWLETNPSTCLPCFQSRLYVSKTTLSALLPLSISSDSNGVQSYEIIFTLPNLCFNFFRSRCFCSYSHPFSAFSSSSNSLPFLLPVLLLPSTLQSLLRK